MEYRLSREEPVQPSRGARRLKRKKTSKTGVMSPEKANKEEEEESRVSVVDPPVAKPRRQKSRASVEMETQEVSADFSGRPDTPDDDKLITHEAPELVVLTDDYGWRPGSLIPSRVTVGVFG
jgi:co-chaperonin GroES (HSP10)